MINKKSVATAYDEHLTLVEWLQEVKNALDNAVLTGITMEQVAVTDNTATYQIVAKFADDTEVTSDTFDLPSPSITEAFDGLTNLVTSFDSRITTNTNNVGSILDIIDIANDQINAYTLQNSINGSDDVIVDVDETNEKLEIHLSAELQAKLARVLLKPSSAPSTRKVVTIDTNGAQDNVDSTSLTTLMGNIVDSDGHKRFVDLRLHNDYRQDMINPEWVSYSKLVLNGHSLRAVVVINIPSGETLADNTYCLVSGMNDQVENMNWLFNKLVADQYFRVASVKLFDNDGNPYSNYFWFTKGILAQGYALQIRTLGNYTNNTANVVTMRVEFNLIIE